MARFNARKLYMIQMLYNRSGREHPLTAEQITELLRERGICCDEQTVIQDAVSLQHSDVAVYSSDNRSFYIEKD